MSDNEKFLSLFTKIDSLEDCPVGYELLVWDGCSFYTTYVDYDVDSGCSYDSNYPEAVNPFIAFMVLPEQDEAAKFLGDGE